MARNMIVRLGVDASDFQKKMAQAGASAESTGRRIKKSMTMDNLGAEVAKIMGWSGAASGVGPINAGNFSAAQGQLSTLTAYRDQLAGAGFDDYQFGLVSERIKELEYDLDSYRQKLIETAEAERKNAEAAKQAAEAKAAAEKASAAAYEEAIRRKEQSLKDFQAATSRISRSVSDIMGWSYYPSEQISSVTRENVKTAQKQLAILREYQRALQDFSPVGTETMNSQVSGKILSLEYSLNSYMESVRRATDAEREAAGAAAAVGSESVKAEKHISRASRSLRDMGNSGRRLSIIPGFLHRIRDSANKSNGSLEKMVRTIRNVSVVSFGLRITRGLFGELGTVVRNYISQDAQLQAQVNGLSSSMGNALAPAIHLVTGALSYALPYVVGISNAIGQLMGVLFGTGWSAAASGANKMASATGSAAKAQKEMNKQLLSFDQINRMEGQKESGGGGSGSSAITPIEAKTPAWAERLKVTFSELFESAEFKAANIGGKIGMVLNTATVEAASALANVNFSIIGSTLADNFNSMVGSINWNAAGLLLGTAMVALPSTVVGFIQTADWPLVATSVSEFLKSSFGTAGEWVRSVDWLRLGEALGTFIFNIDYAGITRDLANLLGSGIGAAIAALWGMIKRPWDAFSDRLLSNTKLLGGDASAGFFFSLGESIANVGVWLWDNFCKPIIDGIKEGFGIHSPSTVFGDIGTNCVNSLADRFGEGVVNVLRKITDLKSRVTTAAQTLKQAFSFEWQLPHLRLPHLSVEWEPVDNVLANFFGVSAFPRLSVQWFAKGGILNGAQLFGRMGSTLLGGGEAGREAILPLDSNTGWMDDLAQHIAMTLADLDGGDVNATIVVKLDNDVLVKKVVKGLRRYARSGAM